MTTSEDKDRYPPAFGDRMFGWVLVAGAITVLFLVAELFTWEIAVVLHLI